MSSADVVDTLRTLEIDGRSFRYHAVGALHGSSDLPLSLKLLLENTVRIKEPGYEAAARALLGWDPAASADIEVHFEPSRVLAHDTTGVPGMVDLATLRSAAVRFGLDPAEVQPSTPFDLIIDHSLTVDVFGRPDAMERNIAIEYRRNSERYRFLKWAGSAFEGVTVIPPGAGIVHQVNIEHLAQVVRLDGDLLTPDTLVGADSHTTMVNGLGVLAWGVGGIEALAAMLGQGIVLRVPEVVVVRLDGRLPEGSTATDLVLRVTNLLRERGVVGAFVEFHGPGVRAISVPDRTVIANMCPEFGSTCALFPIDERTIEYLALTGRDASHLARVEAYAKAQELWLDAERLPRASEILHLDLATVRPAVAGPSRPERLIPLDESAATFGPDLDVLLAGAPRSAPVPVTFEDGQVADVDHGHVAIAAITSCTNTSNPALMLGAALLARNAVERGLAVKPWVKTSLAPGSQVVMDYLARAGLLPALEQLGFGLVGFGCTTCIGNSGPLTDPVRLAVADHGLKLSAVLSGNRNFEGRVNPDVAMNYLASPALVVAYALAGTMAIDLTTEPLGHDAHAAPVFLRDLWPSSEEVERVIATSVTGTMFTSRYASIADGDAHWHGLDVPSGPLWEWDDTSTYLREAPFLDGLDPSAPLEASTIAGARVLAVLGDAVTTDHLSPAGAIHADRPAGRWLTERGVPPEDFNTYPTRRGNHEVLIRAALANPRLRNRLVPEGPGGMTRDVAANGPVVDVYEAALDYGARGIPLIVLAGDNYGNGSSRDWAAKGPALLGVRAIICGSIERIHRSNLVGMGVLPLEFLPGDSLESLGLVGDEAFDIAAPAIRDGHLVEPTTDVVATPPAGSGRAVIRFAVSVRLDTLREVATYLHGGIMPRTLRTILARVEAAAPVG